MYTHSITRPYTRCSERFELSHLKFCRFFVYLLLCCCMHLKALARIRTGIGRLQIYSPTISGQGQIKKFNDRTISDFSKHVHLLATFNFMCFIFVSLNHCYVQFYFFLISSIGERHLTLRRTPIIYSLSIRAILR